VTTQFNMNRDETGAPAYAPHFCDDSWQVALAQNVAQSITVPGTYRHWVAIFSYEGGTDVWVSNSGTATTPTGSMLATSSSLNPGARSVTAGSTLSFITSSLSAEVGICLYAVK
jgi:hypothetical protein